MMSPLLTHDSNPCFGNHSILSISQLFLLDEDTESKMYETSIDIDKLINLLAFILYLLFFPTFKEKKWKKGK